MKGKENTFAWDGPRSEETPEARRAPPGLDLGILRVEVGSAGSRTCDLGVSAHVGPSGGSYELIRVLWKTASICALFPRISFLFSVHILESLF